MSATMQRSAHRLRDCVTTASSLVTSRTCVPDLAQPRVCSNSVPQYSQTDKSLPAKQCYHCQGLGHVQADCPTLRISGGPAGGRCYSCGLIGHLARNCPTPNAGPHPRGAGRGGFAGFRPAYNVTNNRAATCYKCGGPNHYARDCQAQAMKCYACGKLVSYHLLFISPFTLTRFRVTSLVTAPLLMEVRSMQLGRPATNAENLVISARTVLMLKSTGQLQLCPTGLLLMCLHQLQRQRLRRLLFQLHPQPLWHKSLQSSSPIMSPASAVANFSSLFSLVHDFALILYSFCNELSTRRQSFPVLCLVLSCPAPWNLLSNIVNDTTGDYARCYSSSMHRRLDAFHDTHYLPQKFTKGREIHQGMGSWTILHQL